MKWSVRLIAATMMALSVGATAAQDGFDLQLERELMRPPVDPRTEARLAQWDSPMGRLAYQLQEQQSSLMRGSQPGGAIGLGFGLKLQRGVGTHVVVSPVDTGIERYESSIAVIQWPWQEPREHRVLPIEQQLSLLLGRRLEARPVDRPSPETG
jgi:hypothetical protein